jgi:putative acetyltransferase
MLSIESYTEDRAREVTDVFWRAVHAIKDSVYSEKQKEAWASTPPDYQKWKKRLAKKQPFLAVWKEKEKKRVVGFIELESDGHIDCLYVDPDFQKQGAGQELYDYLERRARKQAVSKLYVEASLTAKSFFEKQGFLVTRENLVQINNEKLINFLMEKFLNQY